MVPFLFEVKPCYVHHIIFLLHCIIIIIIITIIQNMTPWIVIINPRSGTELQCFSRLSTYTHINNYIYIEQIIYKSSNIYPICMYIYIIIYIILYWIRQPVDYARYASAVLHRMHLQPLWPKGVKMGHPPLLDHVPIVNG
jgi:hypothetical protein